MVVTICPWPETRILTEHSCCVLVAGWKLDASHIPVQLMHKVQRVTCMSVILDTSVSMCFKTRNCSPHLRQTHIHSMYPYHGKRLKMNVPTSSVSISGLHCLELQALLLFLLELAPKYGCFLLSQPQTGLGHAAEYRRRASTCSNTNRTSKK
jgi:hypothetical protein